MPKGYLSNRQRNLKIGISSYTENDTVLEVTGRVGIGTTNATSRLSVVGDGNFTGIITSTTLNSTVATLTNASGTNLNFTGVSTLTNATGTNINFSGIGTITTLNSTNLIPTRINSSGVSTLTTLNSTVATLTNASGTNLNFSGIGTITTLNSTNLIPTRINSSGVSTLTTLNSTVATLTNAGGTNLNFTGVSTLTNATGTNLNFSGIGTITTLNTTNLTPTNINSSGVSTFSNNINIASGIITTTGSGGVGIGSFLRLKPHLGEGGEIAFDYVNGNAGYYLDVSAGNVFRLANYDATGVFTVLTNSTERLRVSNAGNVGIGTNNPTVALQLSPNASISNVGSATTLAGTVGSALTVAQFYHSNTNASYIRIKAARNAVGSDWTTASTKLVNVTDVTEQGYIEYNPNGSTYGMAFGSGATEWARFTSAGNFGIGVTNPSQKFEVSGTSRFFTSGQGDVTISHSSLVSTIRGASTVQLALGANNSEAIRINTSGNVGIGTTNPTSKLSVVGDGNFTGVVTATTFIGALTGTATTASSVTVNSVGLGTHTYGDYVKDITGTANQITVTSGTGEGSSPTLSIPSQFTAPQDVTVTRDLQVNRNLNVNGNITIGGTSATLFTTEFKVYDPDIVLGFRTDGSGNDVSTDNTANHGGIAIASTEGTPLISLYDVGVGETNPATYKKFMWFKSGTFSGLGTDAWISNYAIGIGSTQVPNGVRLAAGGMQVTDRTLSVPQLNISGVSTLGITTFTGAVSFGTSAYFGDNDILYFGDGNDLAIFHNGSASVINDQGTGGLVIGGANTIDLMNPGATEYYARFNNNGAVELYYDNVKEFETTGYGATVYGTLQSQGLQVAGVSTFTFANNTAVQIRSGASGSYTALSIGRITEEGSFGIASGAGIYANNAVAGDLVIRNNNATGKVLFTRAGANASLAIDGSNVLVGSVSSTGTASQPLQVTGGAYVSGSVGIGTTNPTSKLSVIGDSEFVGVITSKASTSPFVMNQNSINENFTIPVNYNAMTVGPIVTISSGVTITVSSGAYWSITP